MKKTKLLCIALVATIVSFAQAKKDSAEKRLNLSLSELQVAQLQAQLDNSAYFADKSNLPHQEVSNIIRICTELQRRIEDAKIRQWPALKPKK